MRPENETKEEKFRRLAEARTNAARKQIQLIGNLSNTTTYSYDEIQIAKIFTYLDEELQKARTKLLAGKSKAYKPRFSLHNEQFNYNYADIIRNGVIAVFREFDLGTTSEDNEFRIDEITDSCLEDLDKFPDLGEELSKDERALRHMIIQKALERG